MSTLAPTLARAPFLASFADREPGLLDGGPEWLRRFRRAELERFEQIGLPTPGLEEWKNTSVAPITGNQFRPAEATDEPTRELHSLAGLDIGGPRLVFVNGRFQAGLSALAALPDGVWAGSLAEAVSAIPAQLEPIFTRATNGAGSGFAALNAIFVEDGAVLVIPARARLEAPLTVVYASIGSDRPVATHPRTLVIAGENSRSAIVETYVGDAEGVYLTNALTELEVGRNAEVDHYRVQAESEHAFHVATTSGRQHRDSRLSTLSLNLGGRLVRNDVRARLDGEGAVCTMNGLVLTRGSQHVDNHTVIDHAQPHCDSRELYKGILADRSRTVFNGRVIVRPGAQKTDAKQSNANLLLSATAVAHTRPQLEIYADDVKCTHGATIGRLDPEAMFYLRSRGLPETDARNLMVSAFAGEVLETIRIDALRSALVEEVSARLPGASRSEP